MCTLSRLCFGASRVCRAYRAHRTIVTGFLGSGSRVDGRCRVDITVVGCPGGGGGGGGGGGV